MIGRGFGRLPIRQKLLALVLLPMAVVLPLLGLTLYLWTDRAFDQLLITKIRSDLAVARGYFDRVLGEVGASASAVADSHALYLALTAKDPKATTALLERFREREKLDFIELMPPSNTIEATNVEVLERPQQASLDPALRLRVPIALVPTRNAAPTERREEDRAMVLQAIRAVRKPDGTRLAELRAGVLLNRNLPFIDHINEIVYPAGSLPFGSRGTATLFLDDVRISTNVRLFGGVDDERAIGTRVSQAVRAQVLGSGQTWLDRAFVVNDWYVSGYEALADGNGRRVGMLYVGFTEAPFTWIKFSALASLGAVFFAVTAVAALWSLRWARSIVSPLERMAATMQSVGAGAREARVGPPEPGRADEIAQLGGHLDRLLDKVDEHARALEAHNAELDAKVAERTKDLEAAQAQLVHSEKLAAVGQLTASIAHEINNPIAVIQGNLDLMRELLGAGAEPVRAELKIADEQVERMRRIVTQLLQFARPGEYAGYVEAVDVNAVIDSSLLLAGHQLAKSGIEVRRDFRARSPTAINRNELQQVLVNLLVNAIHAMPQGGVLELATREDDGWIAIEVLDTGPGLGAELLAELFKPFVTRKKDGTGLGLWISRTIVERYGGQLLAADRDDGRPGARFTVRLRREGSG